MNIILFDNELRDHLLPLTYTRPVAELRVGILTIRAKWERWLGAKASYITQDYLAGKYGIDYDEENYVINATVLPSVQLRELIRHMDYNEAYLRDDELIVAKLDAAQFEKLMHDEEIDHLNGKDIQETEFIKIDRLWNTFQHNGQAILEDFELLTAGRQSAPLSASNQQIGQHPVFLEEGARVECATLNTSKGPIYIGKDAEVMEGSMLRGPLAIGEHAVVRMGSRVYEGTTLGPWCKVGGELSNSILQGYSNKAHEGFLGNAYIGEWCNIGADTNNSNLKNNYEEVKVWSYPHQRFEKSGTQFCGLFMGDHSKTGINTMLNTGTVIGVSANVFGEGFPRVFIPSFSWGGHRGFQTYRTDKAFDTAQQMMQRRGRDLDPEERLILLRVFEDSAPFRKWENNA